MTHIEGAQAAADKIKARYVDPATGRNHRVPVRCQVCGTTGTGPHTRADCDLMRDERNAKNHE